MIELPNYYDRGHIAVNRDRIVLVKQSPDHNGASYVYVDGQTSPLIVSGSYAQTVARIKGESK